MNCNINKLDMCVNQGATFSQQLTIKAADGTNLVGIDTASLRGQIRPDYGSSTLTASFVFTWTDHIEGISDMTLSATVTAGIAAGNYVYDVEMVMDDGTVYRVLEGKVKVRPEVTT